MNPEIPMDRRTLAEYLGITVGALANMSSRGEGPPFFKVSNRIWYFESEVLEWIETFKC